MMEILEYEKRYKIPVYDIGFDGLLSPHSLFNYLQDIASEHAVLLRFGKDDLMKENRFWVLSRIAVKMIRWPGWEESLTIKTWPRGTEKLFALRDFVVNDSDGVAVALASSSWLVLDRTSRRVQRPDTLLSYFNESFPVKSSLGRNAEKIDNIGDDVKTGDPFRVVTSDLDINLHVNNVNYLKWIIDSYRIEFRIKYQPVSAEINFLAESKLEDEIEIRTAYDKNNELIHNHSVIRNVDNTELCRASIHWDLCPQ